MSSEPESEPEWHEPEVISEEPRALVAIDRQAIAMAASARATLQSRVWIALQYPRSLPAVRDAILAQVKRPSLAARAVYALPRGKKKEIGRDGTERWVENIVEGPSIRLANVMRISMRNMDTTDAVIADDADYRTVMVTALDFETNTSESRTIVVSKTVERKGFRGNPPDRDIISSRKNSFGEIVYKCRATEAELVEAQNSAASRARRNAILALVPADLVEDAVRAAKAVVASTVAQQRQATIERHKIYFAKAGVTQSEIAAYLGRAIDDATADDLVGLEMLVTAITDGHTTWKATAKARAEAVATEGVDDTPDESTDVRKAKGAESVRAAVEKATKGPA